MNTKQAGFTLIEVLVASAILITSIGVLLQLFGSGLDRTQRAGQVAHLLLAQRTIVHTLEAVNPAVESKGTGTAEGLEYQWQAAVSEPFLPVFDPEGYSNRKIALFTMTVDVDSARGKKYQFSFEQLGWTGI